jgi:general secretion pathway protein C
VTPRIPTLLIWALATLTATSLGLAAGQVVWRFSGDDGGMAPQTSERTAAETPRLDLTPILSFAPFGASSMPPPVQQIGGETTMGLTLLGITTAVPASRSRAIIAGGSGPARAFYVGEDITALASLAEIEADHVVLDVDGRLETLSFVKRSAGPGSAVVPGTGPDLRNLIPSTTAPAGTEDPDAVIARYRADIAMNAQAVITNLGLEITDQGYRITDNAAPGVRQAGFRPGDIVTTVNGQKVGDMAADQSYFDEVAASGRARVELLRDGKTIVMSFPLR